MFLLFDLGLSDLNLSQGHSNERILYVLHKVILLLNIKSQVKIYTEIGYQKLILWIAITAMDPKEVIGCHGNSSHRKVCYTQNES